MFTLTLEDAARIAREFAVPAPVVALRELQRSHYQEEDPASREVRLIARADLAGGGALVLICKHEEDAPADLIEAQCGFAELLRAEGVATPRFYRRAGRCVGEYTLRGWAVCVTVQEFAEGEVRLVDEATARDAGALLARMHDIAERRACHVDAPVLFDPFADNDLFFPEDLFAARDRLDPAGQAACDRIAAVYRERMAALAPLRARPRCATQGDLSDCNLYRRADGVLGVFDFNRCGDNIPFADAVMQAVFVARLMDYAPDAAPGLEERLLARFLAGYASLRPFTREERAWFPHLYACITAFWGMRLRFGEGSLRARLDAGDGPGAAALLRAIEADIRSEKELPA